MGKQERTTSKVAGILGSGSRLEGMSDANVGNSATVMVLEVQIPGGSSRRALYVTRIEIVELED